MGGDEPTDEISEENRIEEGHDSENPENPENPENSENPESSDQPSSPRSPARSERDEGRDVTVIMATHLGMDKEDIGKGSENETKRNADS